MSNSTRPTKKQKLLLEYIEAFIAQHGYSPSYREIMNGVGYSSVATVAAHISNLVKRGHLIKREHSARSLEPTHVVIESSQQTVAADDSAWLFGHIEERLRRLEEAFTNDIMNEVYVLVGAIKVLGFTDQALAYIGRIKELEAKS